MKSLGAWNIEDLIDPGTPKVYLCHHQASTTTRAMVLMGPRNKATESGHRRAIDAMKLLKHPNIPELLDFGIDADRNTVWRAYELHQGDRLSDRLRAGDLDWRDVCHIFLQVAMALEAVHSHSLVHRDIHPGRIMISPDMTAWLTGFEFAMTADEAARLSQAPIGDMSYLAPEVISDPNHHGPRADLYALGAVLYEALTGRPAFPAAAWGEQADSAARMLEWKTRADPLDPAGHVDVPEWLANLVRKATHPQPEKRLPDMESFVGWLEAATPAWITGSRQLQATPAGARRQLAPPIASSMVPSIAAPPTPITSIPVEPDPIPANQPPPDQSIVRFATAITVMLGILSGLAFSSLLLLFVEVSMRA